MTFSEFAALSRDEMVAHLRSDPATAPSVRGKSKARKYELLSIYEKRLTGQNLADSCVEAVFDAAPAPPEPSIVPPTPPPVPAASTTPEPSTEASAIPPEPSAVPLTPPMLVTRPVLVEQAGPRRLPYGATTASEVARARAAKQARHRRKHRKALARRRHGWANGQGHPQPYTAHDAQKGLEQ